MVGLSQAAFDLALDYVNQRKQFNEFIANFEGVQFQIADVSNVSVRIIKLFEELCFKQYKPVITFEFGFDSACNRD